jgi:DNA-binding MarR family transcriptional regulator
MSYFPRLRQRAAELAAAGRTAAQIAESLNAEGLRPPKRAGTFTVNAVRDLLGALGLQQARTPEHRPDLGADEWWLRDLAAHLGMSKVTLDSWVRRGWADGYLHPEARLIVVRADPAETERLRTLHETPRGQHMRRPWQQNQEASTRSETEGSTDDDDRTRL